MSYQQLAVDRRQLRAEGRVIDVRRQLIVVAGRRNRYGAGPFGCDAKPVWVDATRNDLDGHAATPRVGDRMRMADQRVAKAGRPNSTESQ